MTHAVDVSVVIPTHNRRPLLAECLDRIYAQRGVEWEVIVVDDASPDDTWTWLSAIEDTRITVMRQDTSQRQAVARNRALAVVRGRFVCFLDDDDLLWPHALRTMAAQLAANPEAVAAIGAREDWFDWQGYRRRDVHPRRTCVRDISADLFAGWSAIPSQSLFRTEIARAVGGYAPELVPCDDRDFLHRVAARGPVVLCPETVVTYRITRTQWRPPGIRGLRERVARRAIRLFPKAQWRAALERRRFVQLIDRAEDECTTGSLVRAVQLVLRAVWTAPSVMASPTLALWVARRLAGRVARRIVPAPSVPSNSAVR